MITSIAEHRLALDVVDALRHRDPLLGDALVVEPFPDATLNDLIADINAELGVTPPNSMESRNPARALDILADSRVRTVVILGADSLTRRAAREFTHLRHVEFLQDVVLVTGADGHRIDELADAPATRRFLDGLAAQHAAPAIPVAALTECHRDLADTAIASIAFLADHIGQTIDAFPKAQLRLGTLAAALQLFDRPRSAAGTLVRLHGLDVALHQRGHRLRSDCHQQALERCAARTQLDLWLPEAIVPTPRRDPAAPLDATLDPPLPATPETVAAWTRNLQRPQTRALYENAVRHLLDWRARNRIAERDHNPKHLEDWAFDRLRAGAAIGTIAVHHSLARRYHAYLLTGRPTAAVSPPPYTMRRGLPALALPDDLQRRISSEEPYRAAPAFISVRSDRLYRAPLSSPQAVRLLEIFGNDLEGAWQRIEALRMPVSLVHEIRPLLSSTPGATVAHRLILNLNGIVLVLGTGIPWGGLPRELNYGTGGSAYRRLGEWLRSGRWPRIRDQLQEHSAIYRTLAWDRVPATCPR